ncbi:MAG TPA: hypothetical protein PKC48_02575 [Sphingorhabdus sp.]|jgi:hypothetical protein|uniref:hypothetical protein n=1 Tax=Sphingorhabdus sp. TaxID=1902408 RepID=UPI002C51EF64|nr:hypothetical protein [Sphingorhabdus sp.]HMT40614.1 hypothetical protein [Sphingorhabdus sp.]HMU21140.1 hypothetical protein [Sphingorhabdus sp.]
MATATSKPSAKAVWPLAKKIKYGAAAIGALLVLWLVFNFADIKAQAKLGASYGAHIACSCRYIEGRPLASCEKDFEPGMELVSVSDDPDNKRVTASVPLLAEAVAERRREFGCIQLNDKEIAELD